MTLAQRIHDLQLRAVAATDEERIKTRSGEYTAITEQLVETAGRAARVATARAELASAGILQDGLDQDQDRALAVIHEVADTVSTLRVDAKLDSVKMQVSSIIRFFGESQSWAVQAWRSLVPTELPTVDDDLLDALENGGFDIEAIRADIEQARSNVLVLRSRSLPDTGDHRRLQEALEVLAHSSKRIVDLVDPIVADLVVRAQTEGVPIDELTPDVVTELRRLGIVNRFRVVIS